MLFAQRILVAAIADFRRKWGSSLRPGRTRTCDQLLRSLLGTKQRAGATNNTLFKDLFVLPYSPQHTDSHRCLGHVWVTGKCP